MDMDRIKGAIHEVRGVLKESIGKITNDAGLQAEGCAEKNEGKIQNALGGIKDVARHAVRKAH